MLGPRRPFNSEAEPPDGRLLGRMMSGSWWGVAAFLVTFLLLDILLIKLTDDSFIRVLVRWSTLGATAVLLTVGLSRRTIRLVSQSIAAERAARGESEALAELTASIAAGKSIHETLSAAVDATARLFGGDVRCTVLLPSSDGLLRLAAWNNETSKSLIGGAFRPGEGFNGTAFSEGRLVRVDDLQSHASGRPDLKNISTMRAMVVAPLIADQRTLGVISAIS